jgi:hypothetical protein
MATAAPTTEQNPIKAAMEQVVGNPLSATAGTTPPISYDDLSGFRSPQQDVISIQSSPGTGASTAETWSHEVALENLKRDQLEFQYTQQQNEIANALRQAENLRSIEASKRAQQEFEMNREFTRAQMANMAETQRLQREQGQRESGEFIQKTGHDPGYYTSGKAAAEQRANMIKQAGSQDYGTGGGNRTQEYLARGVLQPSEVGIYNQGYQTQKSASTPKVGWQQGTGRRY